MHTATGEAVREGRLAPATSKDTEFFWKGAREHKLLIQRCDSCDKLRHPPGPACPACHSLQWSALEASGRGKLYSYIVHHYPPVPGFNQPVLVAVIELAEGTRLVSNIVGVLPETLVIGEDLEVFFADQKEGWTAPQFRRPSRPNEPGVG